MSDASPTKTPAKKKFFCRKCKTITNHTLEATHKRYGSEDESGWWEEEEFNFWVCAGCETGLLEDRYSDITMFSEDGVHFFETIGIFPPSSNQTLPLKRFKKLPERLAVIYRESIMAFNADLDILCAAGLRALIEGICADKGITGRTLEKMIDNLEAYLPPNIVSNLHGFRFIANDALHELNTPRKYDLRLAIEVSEDLLNFLYDLDYKASQLPKPRSRAEKK